MEETYEVLDYVFAEMEAQKMLDKEELQEDLI
jgi:hypothetical protein